MKIICATDFSASAETASRVAASLARGFGDTLVLANAVEPPSDQALDDEIEKHRRDTLAAAAVRLRSLDVPVEERLLRGYPPQALNELGRELDVRMIVVGTHGGRALAGVLLGSMAEQTVIVSERPVLVVRQPSAGVGPASSDKRPLRIVVGIEASAASRAAVAWVGELRKSVSFDVHFVHFYWPPEQARRLGLPVSTEMIDGDPAATAVLKRELSPLIEDLPGRGESSLTIAPCEDSVAVALCGAASARDADMLLVGTHQRSGFEPVRLGSSVQSVLEAATVPVLCVPVSSACGHGDFKGPTVTIS